MDVHSVTGISPLPLIPPTTASEKKISFIKKKISQNSFEKKKRKSNFEKKNKIMKDTVFIVVMKNALTH